MKAWLKNVATLLVAVTFVYAGAEAVYSFAGPPFGLVGGMLGACAFLWSVMLYLDMRGAP